MPALNPAVGLDSVGGSLKHSAPFALTAAACSPQHGARGPLQTVTHQLSGARQSPTAARAEQEPSRSTQHPSWLGPQLSWRGQSLAAMLQLAGEQGLQVRGQEPQ